MTRVFHSTRGSRLFHGVFALIPGGIAVGLITFAIRDPTRFLKQPVVPVLTMLFFIGLTLAVLRRMTDRVTLADRTLTVRSLRTRTLNLSHDVIFWGLLSQTGAKNVPSIMVFRTSDGDVLVPLAHLERRGDLIAGVKDICGAPSAVRRSRRGFDFA